jgi:AbiV family abortive infection protein
VTSDQLLLGSLFALEQAGLLFEDASSLFERRRYSTTAGIAMLALEEVGRHRILLNLWKTAVDGTRVTVTDIENACSEHVEKQLHGQFGTTLRADKDTSLGRLMAASFERPPGSDEWRQADVVVQRVVARRRKRLPHDRHELRQAGFYVDVSSEAGWKRPQDLVPLECAHQIQDAINDYMGALDQIQCAEVYEYRTHPKFTAALAEVINKVSLPNSPRLSTDVFSELLQVPDIHQPG